MKMSQHGLQLLQQWEGFTCNLYKDSAGHPTIGVGHLLDKEEMAEGCVFIGGEKVPIAQGLTEPQVSSLLAQDVSAAESTINDRVKVPLSQNQFDALVSFTFNVGIGAFCGSTLLKLLNEGKYNAVPDQLRLWNKAAGEVQDGLVTRRADEIKLWRGEI